MGDSKILTKVTKNGVFAVNQKGARIEKLILDSQLLLTKIARSDGKIGSSHPCVPIFGPETLTSFGLKQHGDARNQLWKILPSEKSEAIFSYEVQDKGYPKGLSVTQRFAITDGVFGLITKCVNNGEKSLPVNFGEHFYWDALDEGWDKLTINDLSMVDEVKKTGVIKLKHRNIIDFHHKNKKPIVLEQQGLDWAVLWFEKANDPVSLKSWVCIEPIEGNPKEDFFGSEKSMIFPGQSRETELKISLLKNRF